MTIIEAYSVGTPVICSDMGNAGSIVADGVTGLKFEHNKPEALVHKIRMFEKRPFTIDEKITRQYSADENYSQLMKIYGRTIDMGIQRLKGAGQQNL